MTRFPTLTAGYWDGVVRVPYATRRALGAVQPGRREQSARNLSDLQELSPYLLLRRLRCSESPDEIVGAARDATSIEATAARRGMRK